MQVGSYPVSANVTDSQGLSDSDNDTVLVLSTPFFILIDSNLTETSGQALMTPDHTFDINIPTGMDVLSSVITLTGITEKTTEYDISPPPISMTPIGINQFNFINGTFLVNSSPYNSILINKVNMTVTAFPLGAGVQESVFNNSIDGIDVGESHYVVPDTPSTHSWSDDITSMVSPDTPHEVKISKLDTNTIDYRFLVMLNVNKTGYLDTPLNPRAYITSNIIYAKPGDMLTTSHATDITKFIEAGANSVYFVNDRNALVNYLIEVRIRDWNYTQETVIEIPDKFEIENILYASATDQKLMNPEIRHPLKKFTSNLSVFDLDTTTDITASCTVSDDELFIPTELIGPIDIGETRLFNVSYDAPRPTITPTIDRTDYNTGDTIFISGDVSFEGVPVTDGNVSATIYNDTASNLWTGNLNHTGGGTYTTTYNIPQNASLGSYTVSVEAYNDSVNSDNEIAGYIVRMLNVTLNSSSSYIANSNATISGYVHDMANSTPINDSVVTITISNSSGIVNQSDVITTLNGSYSYIRPVDWAGDYNLSVVAVDSKGITGTNNTTYSIRYDVNAVTNKSAYNSGDHVKIDVTVHDKGATDVDNATVTVIVDIPNATSETLSTSNGRLSYAGGYYSGTFTNTTNLGLYNLSVDVAAANATGDSNSNFRVSTLSVTEDLDTVEYIADDDVTISGHVHDN
ncbi:MAG: hypothetical protein KAH86_05365, partial [Methanosarcinales archaeon]|nr:hypothetical protein [Methanosarcinales archaeon]